MTPAKPIAPTSCNLASARGHAWLLGLLTGLFALRVAGQAVQRWLPQTYLPEFGAFQGSSLPYWALLSAQIAILGIMICVSWCAARRALVPNRRLGRVLAWAGALYMSGSLLRIAVGLAVPGVSAWFTAWIPAVFHLVLAGFVLAVAGYHLSRSRLF